MNLTERYLLRVFTLTPNIADPEHCQSKTDKPIAVPLNADAILVLRRQAGKHLDRVFTFKRKPVRKAGKAAWKKALSRAGIDNFRWHDLRHTWATWHVQQGIPLHVLQELGGWSSYEMVKRYAHLSAEHLSEWANKLSEIRTVSGTQDKAEPEK